MSTDLFGHRVDDPLEMPRPRGGCAGGNDACDGSGWVDMGAAYAARMGREHAESRGITLPDVVNTIAVSYERRYEFFRPCRDCNGPLFVRWLGGHLAPGHDRSHCSDEACQEMAPRRRHG
mgnify:CR=1 FL=1